jgi:hypothetical protein
MFTVDKFLGVNEAADGYTELKMGEASRMENFFITDAFNLTLRPGIQRVDYEMERDPAPILASWAGYVGTREYLLICDFKDGHDRLWLYVADSEQGDGHKVFYQQNGALGLTSAENSMVKIFPFSGKLYVMSAGNTVVYEDGAFRTVEPYIPLVITGAAPSGGGTPLENINLLSDKRRMEYSADGEAKDYVLPEEAVDVISISIDNVEQNIVLAGTFNKETHVFQFNSVPQKGVANVEITYTTDPEAAEASRMQIIRCRLVEAYNGSTDTRLFVAGDGTNMCYYSGVTQQGEPSAVYFPAMNEVAVDMSGSPVTGIVRHYSKLLVFKPDGTYTISYEPVTLTDGNTVAGFYLRSANRELGNDVMGQVQTVNNFPRTVTKDGLYEWRITASYYQDERYAKRISDRVEKSIREADSGQFVTCDDNYSKTYYVFLNDDLGTVLVNRYDIAKEGVWCIYRGELMKDVQKAMVYNGRMVFVSNMEVFYFEERLTTDAPMEAGGESTPIRAVWESGFMDFGADFRQKYSSRIYVSILPESRSMMSVTASTDRRETYMEKTLRNDVFSFENVGFVNWTFKVNTTPKIQRVRLKVKKFVYYKLIFKVEEPGARATVLGFDQQVRFSSMVK